MEVPRRTVIVKGPLTLHEKQIAAYLADKKGRSGRYIARQLHRDPTVILRFLHANGSRVRLPTSHMLSDIQKAMIKPMYDKGYSIRAIGTWLGVTGTAILKEMKRQGIPRRNNTRIRMYPAVVAKMRYLRKYKYYTYNRIGYEFGISRETVRKYLKDKT
jgi:IS30 family transposase